METPKTRKVNRTGFRDFVRQQRSLHSAGLLSPVPLFEIKLSPATEESSVRSNNHSDEPLVSIQCGEGDEMAVLESVPLNALVGCSRWFYELFHTCRKEHWSDAKANSIYLPSLTLPIVKSVVDFAIIERRVNPTCSFLVTPPDLENWTLTKDLLGRQRTIFQYTVSSEMALDLCHAALFLEIPALLDVSCRMLGYYIDFIPTVEGIDSTLMHNILSHVSPLKLAVLECLPQYASYYDQLTSVWERTCASQQLDYLEMDVARSWFRYQRFGTPSASSSSYTPRQLYIHHALGRELGQLATDFKIQKSIDEINREAMEKDEIVENVDGTVSAAVKPTWIFDTADRTWKQQRPTSSSSEPIDWEIRNAAPVVTDTSTRVNPDGTKAVGALADLAELERHVPTVSVCFPLDSSILCLLQHLTTLEIKGSALCGNIVTALKMMPSIRNLTIDSIIIDGARQETCHAIYRSFDANRSRFLVPQTCWNVELPEQPTDAATVSDLTSKPHLLTALELLQAASQLPFLESFQFSNVEFEGNFRSESYSPDAWNFVFAPHWRQLDSTFFPSLKNLSLYGSGLTAKALGAILSLFADSPLELFDIASNNISLCSPDIDWENLSTWYQLKHLLIGHNNMRARDRSGPFNIGKNIPPTLETLGLDSITWDSLNSFALGLTQSGTFNIRQIYMHNSGGAPELFDALTSFSGVLCQSLELLDLTLSKIVDQSIINIERIITYAPHLKELRLCATNFTASGLERLVTYLSYEEHSHIKVFWSGVTAKLDAIFPRINRA